MSDLSDHSHHNHTHDQDHDHPQGAKLQMMSPALTRHFGQPFMDFVQDIAKDRATFITAGPDCAPGTDPKQPIPTQPLLDRIQALKPDMPAANVQMAGDALCGAVGAVSATKRGPVAEINFSEDPKAPDYKLQSTSITIPELHRTPQDAFQTMTHRKLSAEDIAKLDIPGTARDWDAYMLLHEMGHNEQFDAGSPHLAERQTAHAKKHTAYDSTEEFDAESRATAHYERAQKLGLVENPDVPAAARAARYFGDMQSSYTGSYSTMTIAGKPGIDSSSVTADRANRSSIDAAKSAVFEKIGAPTITAADRETARFNAIDSARSTLNMSAAQIQQLEDFRKTQFDDPAADAEFRRKFTASIEIPTEHKDEIDARTAKQVSMMAIDRGVEMGKQDPSKVYSTVKDLNAQGQFRQDPVQQTYMDGFTDSAEKFGSRYYQTGTPAPAPAVKDDPKVSSADLQQKYAELMGSGVVGRMSSVTPEAAGNDPSYKPAPQYAAMSV